MIRATLTCLRSPAVFVNAVYAIFLIVLAVVPRSIGGSGLGVSDFVAHAVAYGGQGFLLLWCLRPGCGAARGAILAFAGATAFGLMTEIVQSFLPYRDFAVADLGADAIGAIVGVGIATALGLGRRTAVEPH